MTTCLQKKLKHNMLDFHLTHGTPASQFLMWENLTKCPSLLMDSHLDGLDYNTIPGLFDHLDTIKATHINLDIATNRWIEESYDVFNPDDTVSHNLVLALFLTANAQHRVELSNSVRGNYVFSAVVMYKPMAQNMCCLQDAISQLCELTRSSPSACIGLVPVLPEDLLASTFPCVAASPFGLSKSGQSWLSWLSLPPAVSLGCSFSVPVNLVVAMPLGW